MRKVLFSLTVALYLLLSSGVVVHLHYCMDRLAAVDLFHADHQDNCGDCGMSMNEENDCCHDRTDVIKLVQDQIFHSIPSIQVKLLPAEPIYFIANTTPTDSRPFINVNDFSAPNPSWLGRYRYRTLEVFKI